MRAHLWHSPIHVALKINAMMKIQESVVLPILALSILKSLSSSPPIPCEHGPERNLTRKLLKRAEVNDYKQGAHQTDVTIGDLITRESSDDLTTIKDLDIRQTTKKERKEEENCDPLRSLNIRESV